MKYARNHAIVIAIIMVLLVLSSTKCIYGNDIKSKTGHDQIPLYNGENTEFFYREALSIINEDKPMVLSSEYQDRYPLMNPYGPVINVNTSEVFTTIQEALDDSDTLAGHTIFVRSGVYTENIVINKSIILLGENKSTTIVDGNGNDVITVNADDVMIKSFSIRDGRYGLFFNTVYDSQIESCLLYENSLYGVKCENAVHCAISYCTMYENYRYGGYLVSSPWCSFTHCVFANNTYHGCVILASSNTITTYCNSFGNYYGFKVDSSPDCSFFNCQSYDNTGYGISLLYHCNHTIIDTCLIHDNYGFGIFVEWSSYCSMKNCRLFNTNRAIYLRGESCDNRISRCEAYDNYQGFEISHFSENNIITNCITHHNNYGISISYYSNNNWAYHNNIIDNINNAYDEGINHWDNGREGNYWSDYAGVDDDGDGIGEEPYDVLGSGSKDNYPFIAADGWKTPQGWPLFHHDYLHTGTTSSMGSITNNTVWIQSIGWNPESSPAVAYGKVYIGSKDHIMYCFDAYTGEEVWNQSLVGSIGYSSAAVYDNKVFIGSRHIDYSPGGTIDGIVYCFNAIDGTPLWNHSVTWGPIYSSPVAVYDRVYVGSHDHHVYCFDADTGIVEWRFETNEPITSSPSIINSKIYVGSMDGYLYCLNAFDGSLLWSEYLDCISYSTPVIVENRVYIGSWNHNIYCIDRLNGTIIWNYATGEKVLSTPAVVNECVYIGSYDNNVYCLDAIGNGDGTTNKLWNYSTNSWVFSSPAVADNKVYVGSRDGVMYCFDAIQGTLLWSYDADGIYPPVGGIGSSPAVANGNVYIASTSGNLLAFGPSMQYKKINYSTYAPEVVRKK